MKREAYTHSKIGRLCRLLNIEPAHARGIVASLWYVTSVEAPAGDIGKLENEDIAEQVGTRIDPENLIAALVESRWLDESTEHRLLVHDWPEHCEDSVHKKLARKGLFFADGSMPNLARFGAHEREAIAAAYKPKASARSAPEVRPPSARPEPKPEPKAKKADAPDDSAEFDLFWRCYPRKVAKPQALRAWRETVKVRPHAHAILAALKADIEAKRDRPDWLKFFKHPATWLRAQSWNDEVLVERMSHAGAVTVPVPALFAATPEVTPEAAPEAAPEAVPTTPDEIEREAWVDTFRSHGLPEAADEAEACSMERLRELQAIHKAAIERKRKEVLAKVLGRRVA